MQRTKCFRRGVMALSLVAVVSTGCAGRPSRGTKNTLGADMLRGPAGVTYPAAGLGIDLVRLSDEPSRDARVSPAAARSTPR